MEQTNAGDAPAIPVWMVKSLAAVVSAEALIAILRHWHGYDGSERFVAVVLICWLIAMPVIATWKWKRVTRFEWSDLWPTYMVLMLATMLFSR
jgi:hypothetical protein